MEIVKWVLGVAVGAFLAGVGALQFLDSRIQTAIEGMPSQSGPLGPAGPPQTLGKPTKVATVTTERNGPRVENLGSHSICVLSSITTKGNGENRCTVTEQDGAWMLEAFKAYEGNATCSAMCFDTEDKP